MTYQFKTDTRMKEYNSRKWWIDSKIIPDLRISANSLTEALKKYRTTVELAHYVSISNNAIKEKQAMYIDCNGEPFQIGYVITGKYEFYDDSYKSVNQYIELWVEIYEINVPKF